MQIVWEIVWVLIAAIAGALGAIGLNYLVFGKARAKDKGTQEKP